MKEREIAYKALCEVLIDNKYSNIVLRNNEENSGFITQLFYGTLRNYRLVRNCWQKYVKKLPDKKVCVLLDMAVYELLLMNKPQYATISEAVQIAKTIKSGSQVSFVNAVLRKVNKDDLVQQDIGISTSHPDWLVKMWNAQYGQQVAEKILMDDINEPRISLRVNTMVTDKEELLKDEKFSEGFCDDCLYYDGNIVETDYFKQGEVIIQSESSQLAVKTMDVKEDSMVLDMCAAPGSKTVQIAMAMNNTGKVIANDLYDFRTELIKQNVQKYNLTNVETVNYDATEMDKYFSQESFDYVLLDAPCSGLGTLKHKPEIKITTTGEDIDQIVQLQKQLLVSAAKMCKRSGVLVYSTCTLNKKENEKQIQYFLKENEDFVLVSERTVMPYEYGSDGFYIARLEKR